MMSQIMTNCDNTCLDSMFGEDKIVAFYIGDNSLNFHMLDWIDLLACMLHSEDLRVIVITSSRLDINYLKHVDLFLKIANRNLANMSRINALISLDFDAVESSTNTFTIAFPHANVVDYAKSKYDGVSIQNYFDAVLVPSCPVDSHEITDFWKGIIPLHFRKRKSDFYFIQTNYHRSSCHLLFYNDSNQQINNIVYAPRPFEYSTSLHRKYRISFEKELISFILDNPANFSLTYRLFNYDTCEKFEKDIINMFSGHQRFEVNSKENYASLFPKTLTIISDTSSITNTFFKITSRPAIQFHPWETKSYRADYGFVVHSFNELATSMLHIKSNLDQYTKDCKDHVLSESKSPFSMLQFSKDLSCFLKTHRSSSSWFSVQRNDTSQIKSIAEYIYFILNQNSFSYKISMCYKFLLFYPEQKVFLYLAIYLYIEAKNVSPREKISLISTMISILSTQKEIIHISSQNIETELYDYNNINDNILLLQSIHQITNNIQENPFTFDISIIFEDIDELNTYPDLFSLSETTLLNGCIHNYFERMYEFYFFSKKSSELFRYLKYTDTYSPSMRMIEIFIAVLSTKQDPYLNDYVSKIDFHKLVNAFLKQSSSIRVEQVDICEQCQLLVGLNLNFFVFLQLKNGFFDFDKNITANIPLCIFYIKGVYLKKEIFVLFNNIEEKTVLYGPYIKIHKGIYIVEIFYSLKINDINVKSFCDITGQNGRDAIAYRLFTPGANQILKFEFSTETTIDRLEIRSHIIDECAFTIDKISISKLDIVKEPDNILACDEMTSLGATNL